MDDVAFPSARASKVPSTGGLPNHIALILDGNGRWAAKRGLPRTRGHEQGAKAVPLAVRACNDRGIKYLTLYAFSAANWSRPKEEIDGLMRICREFCDAQSDMLVAEGIRVEVIGDIEELPTPTRKAVDRVMAATAHGTGMVLTLALNYGGRRDMVMAMRAVAAQARAGLIIPEELNEDSIRDYLTTGTLPDPDLVIRTGGERRLSDFLLFESAYAELFFTETFWPDFDETTLDEAIAAYARRERRYGRVEARAAAAVAGA